MESGSLKIKGFTCGIWVAQDQRFYLWNLSYWRSKWLPVESRELKIMVILHVESGQSDFNNQLCDQRDFTCGNSHSRSREFYLWNCGSKWFYHGFLVPWDQRDFTCGNWVSQDQPVETGSVKISLWKLGQSRLEGFYLWKLGHSRSKEFHLWKLGRSRSACGI